MKSNSNALQRSLTLRGRAVAMRQQGTGSERPLWAQLRAGQVGVWFRRQTLA